MTPAVMIFQGALGEARAIWLVDTATEQVQYLNHYAQGFSR